MSALQSPDQIIKAALATLHAELAKVSQDRAQTIYVRSFQFTGQPQVVEFQILSGGADTQVRITDYTTWPDALAQIAAQTPEPDTAKAPF